jgi:hypothetical protein
LGNKKKAPLLGPKSKEADGRKSGKAFEGAVSAEEAAWVVGSRTLKEEDQAHWLCGLFSYHVNLHLRSQIMLAAAARLFPELSHCSPMACR